MVKKYLVISLFLILFFLLYFGLRYSVFFNYDMPRLAGIILDFLKNGTYLTSQNYFQESVWANIAWGPALIFFYAPFFKVSSHPMVISALLSLINLAGFLAIGYLVGRYFSKRAAIMALFFLLVNPYWLTYVRLIYQPSPVTLFIPLSMYLFFDAVFGHRKWAYLWLPFSWVVLIQIYLPTYSFIITSLVLILINFKRIRFKYFGLGVLISIVLLIPCAKFYHENPNYLQRFWEAPNHFYHQEKNFFERIKNVYLGYSQIPVGGNFQTQTAYAYQDFLQNYVPGKNFGNKILTGIFLFSLFWNLVVVLVKKKWRRGVIFLWAICPLWSLLVLRVTDILPRYFLIAIPAALILIALTISDLAAKIPQAGFGLAIVMVIYWFIFDVGYNSFIRDYRYPSGRFSDVAETPYLFLEKALTWVIADAKTRNCQPVVSNNEDNPVFDLWLETNYVWETIFQQSREVGDQNFKCFYLVNYRHKPAEMEISKYTTFGPFAVFNYLP